MLHHHQSGIVVCTLLPPVDHGVSDWIQLPEIVDIVVIFDLLFQHIG